MDLRSKNQDQLLDIGNKALERLEDFETRITSLETREQERDSLLASLGNLTVRLRNQLFALSRDNRALIESLQKQAPEVYAQFVSSSNDPKNRPSLADVPDGKALEQAIEAFLGKVR